MRYLVGIPIPHLDRRGARLSAGKMRSWTKRVSVELTACFGGATSMPAPGVNVVDGKVLYEKS